MASDEELDKLIDGALRQIKPVLKPENGSGLMHMDSAKLLLKIDLSAYILAEVQKFADLLREGARQTGTIKIDEALKIYAQARFGAGEGKR